MAEAQHLERVASISEVGSRPFASVCIVSAHRHDLLGRCLDSLCEQKEPPPFELLVGADEDRTVDRVVLPCFGSAEVIHLSHPTRAGLRNLLLQHAKGDWLLFLDDDVELEPDYLRTMYELAAADPQLAVLGGPNVAPRRSSPFQVVQDAVLSSILGSGPVRRRYGRHSARAANEREFTLCTLAVRRECMVDFDEQLVCAEENELLERLREQGVHMSYQPSLLSYHERRPTWRSFAAQMHVYGHGRGQLIARRPSSLRFAHLVPTGLLLYCALAIPATLVIGPVALIPLLLYLVAVTASGVDVGWTLRRIGAIPSAVALTVLIHICYGGGVLRGLTAVAARGDDPGA